MVVVESMRVKAEELVSIPPCWKLVCLCCVFHVVKSDRVWNHRLVSPYLTADNFIWRYHELIIVMILTSRPVLFPRYRIKPQDRVQSAEKKKRAIETQLLRCRKRVKYIRMTEDHDREAKRRLSFLSASHEEENR